MAPATREDRAPLSAEPAEEAWTDAEHIALSRPHPRCSAKRIREWIRVHCRIHATEIELFGGSVEGVSLQHSEQYTVYDPTSWWQPYTKTDDAIVTFPARPGDRRVIQLLGSLFVRWGGVDFYTKAVLSEVWLSGSDGPTLTIH